MHELFKNNPLVLYPERIIYQFDTVEVFPMCFENKLNPVFELAYEAEAHQTPDFYSVFIVGAEKGRDCIADCATVELAQQIKIMILFTGQYKSTQ